MIVTRGLSHPYRAAGKKAGNNFVLLPKIAFNRMLESNKVHACFKSRRSFTRKSGQEFGKEWRCLLRILFTQKIDCGVNNTCIFENIALAAHMALKAPNCQR